MSRSRFVDRVVWRHALATATLLLVAGVPAHAQGRDVLPTTTLADAIVAWGIHGPAATEGRAQTPSVTQMATRAVALESPKRPSLLVPLYVGFGALQALDAHSTLRALKAGAVESNPMMQWAAGNTTALLAVKSGAAAATIFLADKGWKKHPARTAVLMAVLNAGYAGVVLHNYRVANSLR